MNTLAGLITAFQDEIPNYHPSDQTISSLPVSSAKLRIRNPNSAWIRALEERFDELTSLPRGWDGYQGVPVTFACAQFAANLIESLCVNGVPAPQLVPGTDGTLQLEWHVNQFDLEVDVLGPYEVEATLLDHVTGDELDLEVSNDFSELAEWVVALGQDRVQVQLEA